MNTSPPPRPRVALIAHDGRKPQLVALAAQWRETLAQCDLCGTGTTAQRLREVGFDVHGYLSGPMGGDQQIGARAAEGLLDLVVFLRDPLTAQPHEPDVSALMRVCDVHDVGLATNLGTAQMALAALRDRLGAPRLEQAELPRGSLAPIKP